MMKRNIFAVSLLSLIISCLILLSSCAKASIPKPDADLDSMFGVDKNINILTIDKYLGREDTVYRDMRMLFDPADYAAIGGDADLSFTIKGFKVVPYPFIGTLQALPVDGAYTGETLFTVEWNEDGTVKSAVPNYKESMLCLEELFPKDKNIFLICGGGGYAGMMKNLLIKLGWDESKLYNVGGAWAYKGSNRFEIITYSEDAKEDNVMATWRADYAFIDFEKLHPLGESSKDVDV